MDYSFAVIEHYPNGDRWVHHFTTLPAAEEARDEMSSAHTARRYEIAVVS